MNSTVPGISQFKMVILYEWRDLIENADYLIALQALAILQVSRTPNIHEKIIHREILVL